MLVNLNTYNLNKFHFYKDNIRGFVNIKNMIIQTKMDVGGWVKGPLGHHNKLERDFLRVFPC